MGFLLRGAFVKVSVNSHVCEGRLSITKRDVHFQVLHRRPLGKIVNVCQKDIGLFK